MQYGHEVFARAVDDTGKLLHLLDLFFNYERPEIADFRKAVEQFKADLPQFWRPAGDDRKARGQQRLRPAAGKFLEHARETINPAVTEEDVREMLIQHILTEEIFAKVFDDAHFHRQNNVAQELYKLEDTFFTGNAEKTTLLRALRALLRRHRAAAARSRATHEKQTFLKVIYEDFYKVYNPKAADRLGVVYTPGEIVRFMIESADWLCQKHFGKT